MNSTGDKLRALRNKHNMTAQELADKLGVTAPAISLWEHNKREIDNSTLLRIAAIFNVTTDYLLGAPTFNPTLSLSMTNKEIFAQNLKHYMWLNNINQRDLANSLKVSDASVSHWLNAARMPRIDKLQSIATILGITLQELIEDSTLNKTEKQFKPSLSKRDELDIPKRLNTPEIGNRIKNLRKQYNMTQDELGLKLNGTRNAISQYETDKRIPTSTTLSKLAKIFNVSTDYLINGNNTNFKPTLSKHDELDIQKRLERLMNDLDSETGLAFYNGDEEIDDETRELLRASLESSLRITKLKAKEKFTPKKYRR